MVLCACADAGQLARLEFKVLVVPTGDEILELNGESMAGLTHQDALQKFKVSMVSGYGPRVGPQAEEPRSQHHPPSFPATNTTCKTTRQRHTGTPPVQHPGGAGVDSV